MQGLRRRSFSLRAVLSVIMPLDVETIAMPRPFMTLGHILAVSINTQAGFGTLRSPVITWDLVVTVF